MVETRLGIELDGLHATFAEVKGHEATVVRSAVGESVADALAKVLEGVKPSKKSPPIRVSFASGTSIARRVDVTAKALQDRRSFTDEVYKAIPAASPDDTEVAGLFFNPENLVGNALGAGLAGIAPKEAIEDIYRALKDYPKVEVVPSSFTLIGKDGLFLHIGFTSSSLTLVENGYPVQQRSLPGGGIGRIAELLGHGPVGIKRLEDTINRNGNPDLQAESELNSFFLKLAEVVSVTREAWLSKGEIVPETIYVYGTGSRVNTLIDYFQDVSLTVETDERVITNMKYIPRQTREAHAGAFYAAVTVGNGYPTTSFPSQVAVEKLLASKRAAKRTKYLLGGLALVALPVLAYYGPITAGNLAVSNAENERVVAEDRLSSLSAENERLRSVTSLEEAYSTLASDDPRWRSLIELTFQTASESGARLNSFNTDITDGVVSVTASASAPDDGSYAPLTSWLGRLQSPDYGIEATTVSTSGFSYNAEAQESSFQVQFTIPAEKLLQERGLGEEN